VSHGTPLATTHQTRHATIEKKEDAPVKAAGMERKWRSESVVLAACGSVAPRV